MLSELQGGAEAPLAPGHPRSRHGGRGVAEAYVIRAVDSLSKMIARRGAGGALMHAAGNHVRQ
jgi:hypothetical protein